MAEERFCRAGSAWSPLVSQRAAADIEIHWPIPQSQPPCVPAVHVVGGKPFPHKFTGAQEDRLYNSEQTHANPFWFNWAPYGSARQLVFNGENMKVHLVNPSHRSFGTAVITPRWLFVIAAATPASFGEPSLVDETLSPVDPERIQRGDVVGIGIHTGNALRGYEIGKMARERGAYVVFGGIHATLYSEEALNLGGAHAAV